MAVTVRWRCNLGSSLYLSSAIPGKVVYNITIEAQMQLCPCTANTEALASLCASKMKKSIARPEHR